MTFRRMVIGPTPGRLDTETFVWRSAQGQSSFHTDLGPELRRLGEVPRVHRDLVTFAAAAFLADRTIKRRTGWHREIELNVPVYDVPGWEDLADHLAETLELLSSDTWQVSFTQRPEPSPQEHATHPEIDRVLLFSGGADSLCGAIRSLANGERLLLVSHWDWAGHADVQKKVVRRLRLRFPEQVLHRVVRLSRRATQIGGGKFGDERSRRTRSMLFLSLGLADASVDPAAPLWIAENGYAALNPPLAGERRGALSTRTTHPLVLSRMQQVVRKLGGHADFENPFAALVKSEMYADAAQALGPGEAEKLLALSHSCSHVVYAMGTGYPPATQCGVCFGCLVRRAAFHTSGLSDTSTYLHKAIAPAAQPHHLQATAESEIRSVRYAGSRGIDAADILAVGVPDGTDIDAAVSVAQRGLAELAAVVDAEPDLRAVQ